MRALTPPGNRRVLISNARHLGHDYHGLIEAGSELHEDTQRSGIRKWIMALPSPPLQDFFHGRAVICGSRSLDMALRELPSGTADLSPEDMYAVRLERPHPERKSSILYNARLFAQDRPNSLTASSFQDGGEEASADMVVGLLENARLNNALPASADFSTDNARSSAVLFSHSSIKHSAAMSDGVHNDEDPFVDPSPSGTRSYDTGYSSAAPSVDIDSLNSTSRDDCKRHGRIFTSRDINDLNLVLAIAPRDPVEAFWVCDLQAFHGGFERCCACGQQGS